MKRPPMMMRVQIHTQERRFALWLPLFLLLPLAVVLLIVLSPLILIAILVLKASRWRRRLSPGIAVALQALCSIRAMKAALDMFCSTPGLLVEVCGQSERVHISVV